MRQTGIVKFFNTQKGYGFITPDDGGKDVFVHVTAVERSGIGSLNEGMRISFETEPDKRGKGPKAVELKVELSLIFRARASVGRNSRSFCDVHAVRSDRNAQICAWSRTTCLWLSEPTGQAVTAGPHSSQIRARTSRHDSLDHIFSGNLPGIAAIEKEVRDAAAQMQVFRSFGRFIRFIRCQFCCRGQRFVCRQNR